MLLRIYVPATGKEEVLFLVRNCHDVDLQIAGTLVVLRCSRTCRLLFKFDAALHFPTAALDQSVHGRELNLQEAVMSD